MKGTHGTCASHASAIEKKGFISSSVGIAGVGIYFWSHNDDNETRQYATDPCHCMVEGRNKNGFYSKCADTSCSVIYVNLSVNKGVFIDLEGHELKLNKTTWVNKAYARLLKRDHNRRLSLSTAYDLYIKMLEEELQHKIDIYYVTVNPPTGFDHSIPVEIRGWPGCYVVRDNKCIQPIQFTTI